MVYIPSIRRNLIYVPILDKLGYSFLFGTRKFELYRDSLLISNGMLCRNLYILELYGLLYVSISPDVNTISSTKHLGHISKQRMEKFIKDGILLVLNFSDFDTCIDCIKGKLTIKVDRCTELLRVIHTDICEPLTPPAMGGHKYFITFDSCHSRVIRNQQNLYHKFLLLP